MLCFYNFSGSDAQLLSRAMGIIEKTRQVVSMSVMINVDKDALIIIDPQV
ncbi:MAG: hypothetical protein K6T91_06915 [Firmicutes bacterium]|nr:hypothetical protein [Bacillota bacterium]